MDRGRRALALTAAALLGAACSRPGPVAGPGRRLAPGPARGLAPSPDGAWLAWLDRCARPPERGLPADALSCDLQVAPVAGGAAQRIAQGVKSFPGGFAWSRDGKALAALADHDHGENRGALVRWRPGGEPERLAAGVGFFGFGPAGVLAFVATGQLHLAAPAGAPEPVARASAVATFEFSPGGAGASLLARRQTAAGGALLVVRSGAVAQEVPGPVGDYAFSPAGDRVAFAVRGRDGYDLRLAGWAGDLRGARTVGRRVQSFAFSRDGSAVAYLADAAPGKAGDLYLAPAAGGPGQAVKLASAVGEFRWAAAAPRLAWLQDFDARVRSGTLAAGGPGTRPAVLGRNVTAYDLSPDGSRVAFLEHVTSGGYSVDLKLSGAPAGRATVASGVFGFDFSPEGDRLYYRTACVRNAEACDLYRIPAAGLSAGEEPERIAEGVKSFDFDRRSPGRLLIGWSRRDLVALDLAVWEGGKLLAVDRGALAGSAVFLASGSGRLAYVVAEPARAGVYLAELPR